MSINALINGKTGNYTEQSVLNCAAHLVNWNHGIIPTPIEDIVDNIKSLVKRFTGYTDISVGIDIEDKIFEVNIIHDDWPVPLVRYDGSTLREVHGKLRMIGIPNPMTINYVLGWDIDI